MSESASTSTTGTAYVFVKLQGKKVKKKSGAKRVFIPTTLQAFRKSCQSIFRLRETAIRAFYDSENKFIHHISELEPGTTIIASTDQPEGEDANFDFEQKQKEKQIRIFDPSAPLLYAEFPKTKKVPFGAAPKCMVIGFPEALTVDQANLRRKQRKETQRQYDTSSSRTSRLASSFSKRSSSPLSPDGKNSQLSNQNFHFFDQTSYTFVGSETATISTTSVKPQKVVVEKQVISKTRLDQANQLLSRLFSQEELSQMKEISNAFSRLSNKQRKFIAEAETNENNHKALWINSAMDYLTQFHFCEKTDGLFLNEEVRAYARESVRKHRFIAAGCGGHRFNTGIIGPPKSGKSTLLEIYAQEAILDFGVCGDWKNYFLFCLDIKDIIPLFNDLKGFYLTFVKMICEAIPKQKPIFIRLMPDIKHYFESIVTSPEPLVLAKSFIENIPQKKIQNLLIEIGEEIAETWKTPYAMESWITLVFQLPILIPRALGLTKTIFIVDNIEYSDIKLEPFAPFEESKRIAFISEHLKYTLSQCDYIFACHDLNKLYQVLISIDSEGVDLFAITDFITTNGISKDIVENDLPLIASLSTQDLPFIMKGSDCDGVPYFIMFWKDLNQAIEEELAQQDGTDEYEDAHYFAICQAQAMINLIYFSPDADYTDPEEASWPHVLSVRRASEDENSQFLQEEKANQMNLLNQIDAIPIDNAPNIEEEGEEGEIQDNGIEPIVIDQIDI